MLDIILRAKERYMLLRKLKNWNVTVVGNVSKSIHREFKSSFSFKNPCSLKRLQLLMKESSIVVNSSPKTLKEAFHERILYSFAFGASSLTDVTPFLAKEFPYPLALLPIHGDIDVTIDFALKHAEERYSHLEHARKIVFENHTWDNHARALVNIFSDKLVHAS